MWRGDVPRSAVDALRFGLKSTPEIEKSAIQHGHDLPLHGFTVSQVVHDYGDICQAISELAVQLNASVSTDDFRMLNRCLDEAIARAATHYARNLSKRGCVFTVDLPRFHVPALT
jgi:hypothetical protein